MLKSLPKENSWLFIFWTVVTASDKYRRVFEADDAAEDATLLRLLHLDIPEIDEPALLLVYFLSSAIPDNCDMD